MQPMTMIVGQQCRAGEAAKTLLKLLMQWSGVDDLRYSLSQNFLGLSGQCCQDLVGHEVSHQLQP